MNRPAATVTLTIDGRPLTVPAQTSVAAAILNRGASVGSQDATAWHLRTSLGGRPRGPLCGMGICFECRATIDEQPHQRTCQTMVRDGMEIRTDG
jgi:sarcosine oxidase subunit alpha